MMEHSCCFTGHRSFSMTEDVLSARLKQTIALMVERGVTTFFAGGAQGFDLLAEEAVLAEKEKHPELKLILCLPFPGHTKNWPVEEQLRQDAVSNQADELSYVGRHYFRGCMHIRNRQMVEQSRFCVCLLERATGGTASTVAYARKKGRSVLNLADQTMLPQSFIHGEEP